MRGVIQQGIARQGDARSSAREGAGSVRIGSAIDNDTQHVWLATVAPFLSFAGLVILLFSLSPIARICREARVARGWWEVLQALIVLFIVGYALFGLRVLVHPAGVPELIGSLIALGGSIFVLLVTRLSLRTLREVRDLTVLETENRVMRAQWQRLESVLETTAYGIIVFDAEGRIDIFNRAAERLFKISETAARGEPVTRFLPLPEGAGPQGGASAAHLRAPEGELTAIDSTGRRFPVTFSTNEMVVDGQRMYTCLVDDISERKAMLDNLRELAEHDSLTGLYNRHYFIAELRRVVERAKRAETPEAALLYIDLDNFKAVNDSFGHVTGDEVLREIASRLRERAREGDLLARLGGDEFAIIAYGVGAAGAVPLAESYRRALGDYSARRGGRTIRVGASVGLALVTGSEADTTTALSQADFACQVAKRAGGNRAHVYRPEEEAQLGFWP